MALWLSNLIVVGQDSTGFQLQIIILQVDNTSARRYAVLGIQRKIFLSGSLRTAYHHYERY